jgi:hypothetical protein
MKILQANLIKLVCVGILAYFFALDTLANSNFRKVLNLNADSQHQLLINEQALINSHNFKLEFTMNVENLLKRTSYPQQIKVKAYTINNQTNEENIVSIINSNFYNARQAINYTFSIELQNDFASQDLYFDIYDSEGKLSANFKEFIKTPNQVVYEKESLQEANCDPNSFGDCQIKYLLDSLNFVAIANRNRDTVISRENSGKYTIGLPLMRVNNMRVNNHYTSLNTANENNNNSIGDQNPDTLTQTLSDTYSFVSEGLRKASLVWNNSVNAIEVFFAGDKASKFSFTRDGTFHTGKLKLNSDQGLSINPEDGLIEFDGDKLYITKKGSRQEFFRQGLQGPPGPPGQAGRPGRDGSFSGGDADVNGTLSFLSTGKLTNAVLDGSLTYTSGAQNGYVLMSDDNGNASWASIGSVINGSGMSFGASAHGTAGAIQFSDGSGELDSDANSLSWNNTDKTLVVQAQAGQTANLQEWKNSAGTSGASINATGSRLSLANGAASMTASGVYNIIGAYSNSPVAAFSHYGYLVGPRQFRYGWNNTNSWSFTPSHPDTTISSQGAGIISFGGESFTSETKYQFCIYNAFTDANNYERGVLDWKTTNNTLRIGTEANGTGTGRDIHFIHGASASPAGGIKTGGYAGIGIHSGGTPGTRAAWVGTGVGSTGYYSSALGWSTTATSGFSTAIGAFSRSTYDGRISLSQGQGPVHGNQQQSGLQTLTAQTTNNTPTVLSIPNTGSATHTACSINTNSSITIRGVVTALRDDRTETAGFQVEAVWQRNGNTTTLVGSNITQISNNGDAWSIVASADDANNRWVLSVIGENGKNIRWSGMFTVAEVTY